MPYLCEKKIGEIPGLGMIYLGAVLLLGTYFSFEYAADYLTLFPHATLYDIHYGFGRLVENLARESRYHACYEGNCFTAHRMPFIPLFLTGIAKFTISLPWAIWIKNLIFSSLSGLGIWLISRELGISLLGFILFNLLYFLCVPDIYPVIEFEEGYLYPLIALLYAAILVNFRKRRTWLFWVIGFSLGGIAMTKSSAFVFVIVTGLLLGLLFEGDRRRVVGALTVVLVFWTIWGSFCLVRTGHFAFGSAASSWNGWNLYKGNNPHTLDFYPYIHLDRLDDLGLLDYPDRHYEDEWKLNAYYVDKARDFVQSQPWDFLQLVGLKCKQFFIEFRDPQGEYPGEEKGFRFSLNGHILLRLIKRLCLVWAMIQMVVTLMYHKTKDEAGKISLLSLGMVLAYAFPFCIGFAYYRHADPVFAISLIYLLYAGHERLFPFDYLNIRRNPLISAGFEATVMLLVLVLGFYALRTVPDIMAKMDDYQQKEEKIAAFHASDTSLLDFESLLSSKAIITNTRLTRINHADQMALKLTASSNDPVLLLPPLSRPIESRLVLRADIISPIETFLQVFYPQTGSKNYSEAHSKKYYLAKGSNSVYLLLPPLNGRIRLDPGQFPGDYIFHDLEIRAIQ